MQAAVLTPSQTKKWLKRKKSIKSQSSFKEDKLKTDDADKGSEISDDICEPTLVFFLTFMFFFYLDLFL